MTFGALPFLIAALAAAIPVILHMINRQKVKDLPFSTLRFLKISAEKTRQRKRIHDMLLMLIRMAALVLIALGLARPTITNLGALWGGGSGAAVAIILDNSASMGTVDYGRMRLETALHAAGQIMDELGSGDHVALWLAGGPKFPEEGNLDRTQENVRQMLSQCAAFRSVSGGGATLQGLSYQRADLGLKVQQAQELLAKAKATNKYIYVLSDLQSLSWDSLTENRESAKSPAGQPAAQPEDGAPAASTGKKAGENATNGSSQPSEIPIVLIDCNRAPEPNVALTGVDVKAALMVTGQPVKVSVQLFNAATIARKRRLELFVDGNKVASSREIEIPPGSPMKYDEADFVFNVPGGGLHRGEVRLAGKDGSALDDRWFFSIEADPGIPVAVVKSQRHEIPYLEDTFYVEQAFSPGKQGDWAIRTVPLTAGDLLSEPLANYKAIYCVNLPAADADTAARLRSYVVGGGNLVWICGEKVDPAAYNQMNQQAGGQLLPAPVLDIRTPGGPGAGNAGTGDGQPSDSWNISFLDKQHPALADLAEPASLYQSVLVYKHLRIDASAAADARVLARLADGEPLLVERNVEKGKVLMLGISAHIDWSNMPLRPIFLPLLARLTFDLAGTEQSRHETLAGSPLVLPIEGTKPSGVELLTPAGNTIRLKADDKRFIDGQSFHYDDTYEIGVYQVRLLGADRAKAVAYSVNVDPEEADPAKISREELQKLFAPTPLVFAEDPDNLASTFAWLREGKSLWGLFLSCVLAALVLETFVANRLSATRDEDQTRNAPPGMRRLARKGRGAA